MRWSIGIKRRERDVKQTGTEKDDAMIRMFEQSESIEAQAFVPGQVLDRFGRLNGWQQEAESGEPSPQRRANETSERGRVGIEHADEQTSDHPTNCSQRTDETELALRVGQL